MLSCVEARRSKEDKARNYFVTTEGGEGILTKLGAEQQENYWVHVPSQPRKIWVPRMHEIAASPNPS